MEVVVYTKTKSRCVQCDATIRALKKHQIPFVTKAVEDHLEEALAVVPDALTAPIVVVDGRGWSGYRPTLIEELA